ncbi:fructose transport system substrate-binding protein [Meinhardsimonia xiamenensis]|jgi:fructose transport system substrate-binding protein|uniref:Fructose transport system substrate-binding protein n=1 Tax=Meinhardsimonia xiamenensis TaxID=990712 RepID=A0A1G9BIS4_9RHOB|nr:sugar ABC transporter substrate-binding protein [Meinhardsimonia xiamenensis]PRX34965.1 fructose transport system substrate-binding protein [Meinhardsimonia xiamenensis]SDK39371.1 fructose transport system substrate-binding protein [Meinhardsimonia xiamenensis]
MKGLLATTALVLAGTATMAMAETKACLITKTDTNPFFVKMKEGATAKAQELGIELMTFAGKIDGDVESQVAAVESCIAAGAKGILITPSDSRALAPVVTEARENGLLVIALDTPFEPADVADATFATDNFRAGELIGMWARAKLGDEAANARIALLDLNPSEVSVDYLRDGGFLHGFGIDIKDPTDIGDEDDPRIVGHDVTNGNEEGGRKAMENLLQIDPNINVVYTINEPAAAGAWEALKAAGKSADDVIIVSVDGGCPGVRNVAEGIIDATAQQYPLRMAALGVEAIARWAEDGSKPAPTPGKDFFDTGVALVTDQPVEGVPSISSEEGLKLCWG